MKITRKVIEFYLDIEKAVEVNSEIIANEFSLITGKKYDFTEINISCVNSYNILLKRSSCGRGCCSEETIGRITVSLKEIAYPSLWINKARLQYKKEKKIENTFWYAY